MVLRSIGLLLVLAAILKAHALVTNPVWGSGLLDSRWFQIGWVEFELFFGGWLLTGWYAKATRIAALILFTVLAGASFAKAVGGETDCGCFGAVQIHPWFTLLLDTFAIVLLAMSARGEDTPVIVPGTQTEQAARQRHGLPRFLTRFITLALCLLPLGLPAGWAMATSSPGELADNGEVVGSSDTIVLTPDSWVGKPFPLLAYVEIGAELSQGEWIVVLHRAGCSKCESVLSRYTAWAETTLAHDRGSRIAFVRVPFLGEADEPEIKSTPGFERVSLPAARRWFVETPSVITLRNGIIIDVETPTSEPSASFL